MSSPYTSSFGMVPHATLSGELPAPSMYMGIHLSPQVSSTMMYGRSPMVSHQGMGPICWHMLALPPVPCCPGHALSLMCSICTAAMSSSQEGAATGGAPFWSVWVVGPVEAAELTEKHPLMYSCVFGSPFWPLSLACGGSSKQGPCAEPGWPRPRACRKRHEPSLCVPSWGFGTSLIMCPLLCAGGF